MIVNYTGGNGEFSAADKTRLGGETRQN